VNYHSEVGNLLDVVASAIRDGNPIDPRRAKYARDLLEGRFVPIAPGMNACATGFGEVVDVSFGPTGIPTWIARNGKETFAFRGFGPDGGPGALVEIPKDWHVELVHGVSEDAPIVAWPKKDAHSFVIHWDGEHRQVRTVDLIEPMPSFAIWKDGSGKRFAAVFGPRGGQLTCLDDPSLDQCYQLHVDQRVMGVIERGGRVWILVRNSGIGAFEVVDDRGVVVGNGPTNCVDVSVRDGKPAVVSVHTPNHISYGNKTYSNAHPTRQDISDNNVVNRNCDVILYDAGLNGLVDTITGATFNPHTPCSSYVIAATDDRLFVANDKARLQVHDRKTGDLLTSATGVRTHDAFRQFGDDVCVAFENGNWHVFYGADGAEWNSRIPSTDHIQLLPGKRAAIWKFVDGTLYTRVVKCNK